MSTVLILEGEVRPRISLEPGGYVSLVGVVGRVEPEHLDIINHQEKAVKILELSTDLEDNIRWELDVVEAGRTYRLTVQDVSKTSGDYSGHLYIRTDDASKPELVAIINGRIRER